MATCKLLSALLGSSRVPAVAKLIKYARRRPSGRESVENSVKWALLGSGRWNLLPAHSGKGSHWCGLTAQHLGRQELTVSLAYNHTRRRETRVSVGSVLLITEGRVLLMLWLSYRCCFTLILLSVYVRMLLQIGLRGNCGPALMGHCF